MPYSIAAFETTTSTSGQPSHQRRSQSLSPPRSRSSFDGRGEGRPAAALGRGGNTAGAPRKNGSMELKLVHPCFFKWYISGRVLQYIVYTITYPYVTNVYNIYILCTYSIVYSMCMTHDMYACTQHVCMDGCMHGVCIYAYM